MRELLLPHEDKIVVLELQNLELGDDESWTLRLNHQRLGFELFGYSPETKTWNALNIRAEMPLGIVLNIDQVRSYRYLALRFSGNVLGILTFKRMTQLETISQVQGTGTRQLIFSGIFAFLVIASLLLFVFFGRRVYAWYFSFFWVVGWLFGSRHRATRHFPYG